MNLDPIPDGDKAAGVDAILRTRGTTLGIYLLDAADEGWTYTSTAEHLNVTHLAGTHLADVSREAVRRWTNWYRNAEVAA